MLPGVANTAGTHGLRLRLARKPPMPALRVCPHLARLKCARRSARHRSLCPPIGLIRVATSQSSYRIRGARPLAVPEAPAWRPHGFRKTRLMNAGVNEPARLGAISENQLRRRVSKTFLQQCTFRRRAFVQILLSVADGTFGGL